MLTMIIDEVTNGYIVRIHKNGYLLNEFHEEHIDALCAVYNFLENEISLESKRRLDDASTM